MAAERDDSRPGLPVGVDTASFEAGKVAAVGVAAEEWPKLRLGQAC